LDTVSASFLQLLKQYFPSIYSGTHLTQNLYQHQFSVVSSDPVEYLIAILNEKDSKMIKATNETGDSDTANYVLKSPWAVTSNPFTD